RRLWCGAWVTRRVAGATVSWPMARLPWRGRCTRTGGGPATRAPVSWPRGQIRSWRGSGGLPPGGANGRVGSANPKTGRAKLLPTAGAIAALTIDGTDLGPGVSCVSIDAAREYPDSLQNPIFPDTGEIAYVIFTSGSTGQPKGVDVPHSAAMNTVDAVNEWFAV